MRKLSPEFTGIGPELEMQFAAWCRLKCPLAPLGFVPLKYLTDGLAWTYRSHLAHAAKKAA